DFSSSLEVGLCLGSASQHLAIKSFNSRGALNLAASLVNLDFGYE
ncbi:5747_t:CDS:1, partial [Scutellospora calospora]